MTELLTRSTPAPIVASDVEARTVTVRLCRWNDPRTVNDPGVTYREQYPAGSIELAEHVHVVDHHFGDLIGRADPATLRDDGAGPVVDVILARSTAANDTLALIDAGVIRSVSMELEPIDPPRSYTPRPGELVTRSRNVVHGIAFAFRPAHDAPVLAIREQENPTMTTTTDPAAPPEPTPPATPAGDVTMDVLTRSLDELRDDLTRTMIAERSTASTGPHPASQYRSLVDWADDLFDGRAEDPLLRRALADNTTNAGENAGVIPPAWLSTVVGIITQSRPVISSIGGGALPNIGMEVDWPYFDGDLGALVDEQATQKSPITSVKVDLKKASAPIKTYAGGSDVSYQLIRRSSPSYRENYLRILMNAYALRTEAVAAAGLLAAATASAGEWNPATDDLKALAIAVFTAAVEVEDATGAPATVILASSDRYIAAGGELAGTATSTYGTQNVPGTATAAGGPQVSVAGLPVRHAPRLTAGTLIVTNAEAAAWWDEGPFTVTAEDVEKLGQNVAVWGMGAYGTFLANGVRQIEAGA